MRGKPKPTITPEQLPESINFQLEYLPEFQKLWGHSSGLIRCIIYQAILEGGWEKAKLLMNYNTLMHIQQDLITEGYLSVERTTKVTILK